MGVESVIERAFEEARAYRATWDDYRKAEKTKAPRKLGPPPRVDLRLEALAGILDGSIKIHSHCYRSDEILMLLRTAQKYGVRVQSLQHVLEGYKVAAEIAAHGASASTFSDWWAYKIEAYDAIPYNAALLTEAGASVCIKSDDAELMRHLNLEAAKMVKYGGVSESPGPGDDHDQPRPRAGARRAAGLDRGGQGRRHRALQRPSVRRLLAVRAGLDRRRGLSSSGTSRAAGFGVRPGEHTAMPAAPESVRNRIDRDRRAAQEPLRPGRRQSPPGLRPGNQGGNPGHRRRQDRGDRAGRDRRSRPKPRPSR